MNDYDFSTLNDKQFEILCTDLLSEEFGSRIERFKPGKDKGIDGRFFISPDRQVILQCKHWLKSGVKNLLNYLSKKELPKISKLNPDRYILAVSLPLSKLDKESILKTLSPHIRAESDIFGKEDLNDLLKKHPTIETNNFNLWLSSANVLKGLWNAAILGRSAFLASEIIEDARKFVFTSNFDNALTKVKDCHNVIITGEPGVGKTTLAHQLILHHMQRGYEIVCIENDLSEAESIFLPEKKQLFYFDDFLGRNYLTALNDREDTHVVQFMERVRRAKNKRFLLTSRTNIFNQGRQLSIAFDAKNIKKNEFEVRISSLQNFDKAQILYNHIWFSELNEEYIAELYEKNRYLHIIKHKNFNPRLVSFITDAYKVAEVPPAEYWKYIEKTLSNPTDVWAPVFDVQISECQRILVMIVAFYGRPIQESVLKNAYEKYLSINPVPQGNLSNEFEVQVRILTGSLLNRHLEKENATFDLFNPSIGDFVLGRFANSAKKIIDLAESLHNEQAIHTLKALATNQRIDAKLLKEICEILVRKELANWANRSAFTYCLMDAYFSHCETRDLDSEIVSKMQNTELSSSEADTSRYCFEVILQIFAKCQIKLDFQKVEPSVQKRLQAITGEDELKSIGQLLDTYEVSAAEEIFQLFEAQLEDHWIGYIQDFVTESGCLDDYYPNDESRAQEAIWERVSDELREYSANLTNLSVERIIDEISVSEILEENAARERQADDDYDYHRESVLDTRAEDERIQDLFDRSGS